MNRTMNNIEVTIWRILLAYLTRAQSHYYADVEVELDYNL